MKSFVFKIFIAIVFCCYTSAFLELDFGSSFEQTWHDEYDSYTKTSIDVDFSGHFFLSLPFVGITSSNPIPQLYFNNLYIGQISNKKHSFYNGNKLYIKNDVFLI